jgi:hypothetical protein
LAAGTTLTGVQENYRMANDNDLIEMYGVPDTFARDWRGSTSQAPCRRLTFIVRDPAALGRAVVAKLILPAEALADLAQMLAADIHVPKAPASLSPNALAN